MFLIGSWFLKKILSFPGCIPSSGFIYFVFGDRGILRYRYNHLLLEILDSQWDCFWFAAPTKPSAQFSSVAQSCPTLCDPMNRSTPGLPVHHQLPEFTQTHVHQVCDAIQPPHPLSSPSPPAPNPSQHQSLFQWVNSSHEVAKVLDT